LISRSLPFQKTKINLHMSTNEIDKTPDGLNARVDADAPSNKSTSDDKTNNEGSFQPDLFKTVRELDDGVESDTDVAEEVLDIDEIGEELDADVEEEEALGTDAAREELNKNVAGEAFNSEALRKDKRAELDEDVLALFKRRDNGDASATITLAEKNMALARCYGSKIWIKVTGAGARVPKSFDQDDMIQDAYIGMIQAIDKFDLDHGVKFSTYATPKIQGSVWDRYLLMGSLVHVPKYARGAVKPIESALEELRATLGREPSAAELAKMQGWEPGKAERQLLLYKQVCFSAYPLECDDDIPVSLRSLGLVELKEWVNVEALSLLDKKERLVVELHFGLQEASPLKNKEAAERLGVTVRTFGRLKASALEKIRKKVRGPEVNGLFEMLCADDLSYRVAKGSASAGDE